MTPLTPLFWTSGDVYPGFKSQGGCPLLHVLSPACNGILIFTSGATPADLLVVNMAVELFWSTYLWTSIGGAWVWHLLCHCPRAWDKTDAPPTELCRLGKKPICISFSLHWWTQAFIGHKLLSGDLCVIMRDTAIGVSQLFSRPTCPQAFEAFFLSTFPSVFLTE